MNKKFLIAWAVLFVVSMIGGFVVHGVLLHADYAKLPNLFRPEQEAQKYFGWMLLAHVLFAGAFAWIYQRGRESKPWLGQGVRYGVAIALLTTIPVYMIYYAVQPMPGVMVGKQIVFDSILTLLLGVVVAWLYRDRAAA